MSVFDKFETGLGGSNRRVDEFVSMAIIETSSLPMTYSVTEESYIRLRIGASFFSTPETRALARKLALTRIAHEMFSEIFKLLRELDAAIYEGNREKALHITRAIESEITP